MLWINIKRVIKSGFIGFWRNGFLSMSSVLVMSVTLFVIASLFFNNILLSSSLNDLKDKVDVNVYMATTASEKDALFLKQSLEALPEVKSVSYISRNQALENFKKRHENDAPTLEALQEVSGNPLSAVLNVIAKDPGQYEAIANYLKSDNALSKDQQVIVRKVDYEDNKKAIERLTDIISSFRQSSAAKTAILVIISIIVILNTIRLVIYTSRDEISVMRLVGATNRYIRWPFVIMGMLYGVVAGVVAIAVFYPLTYWFGPIFYPLPAFLTDSIGNLTLYEYYIRNFGQIFGIIMGSGVFLGAVSSYLSVKRYLTI